MTPREAFEESARICDGILAELEAERKANFIYATGQRAIWTKQIRACANAIRARAAERTESDGWVSVPEDLLTHLHDWEKACKIAEGAVGMDDDKSYWAHQLQTIWRIKATIKARERTEPNTEAGNGGQNPTATASQEAPADERCQSSVPPTAPVYCRAGIVQPCSWPDCSCAESVGKKAPSAMPEEPLSWRDEVSIPGGKTEYRSAVWKKDYDTLRAHCETQRIRLADTIEYAKREWKRAEATEAELAALKERLAAIMIDHGFATGHGDTVQDMFKELDWQLKERGAEFARLRPVVEAAKDVISGKHSSNDVGPIQRLASALAAAKDEKTC